MAYITETQIANGLLAIFERLDALEKATSILARHHMETVAPPASPAPVPPTPNVDHVALLIRLERLTLKRHAVLTATLGGLNYQQIADKLGCNTTTVKLQLKGALQTIGVRNRTELRLSFADSFEGIPDDQYLSRFNISRRWWMQDDANLLSLLRQKKAAHNQHVKP